MKAGTSTPMSDRNSRSPNELERNVPRIPAQDDSEEKKALRQSERHARNLVAELQHRVRNTLAVVRSIARRTAERSESVEDMIAHFDGRLNAFSRVQAAIGRAPNGGINLKGLIDDELVTVAVREGGQFRATGPEIALTLRAAESLSLAIHELATNAVKYGALSTDNGRVKIKWDCVGGDGQDRLEFEWLETGLDEPPRATHEGFGHELLLRSLPYDLDAETDIEFTDDGLRFTMGMPLGPDVRAE